MTIEQRLEQLEQQNQKMQLQNQKITVHQQAPDGGVDDDGRDDLRGGDDGGGLVRTYSAKGKNLVMLNSAADHGTITTYQPNGKMLVDLTANPNGGVGAVYNKTGERIVSMSADEYGNGVVGAYNRKGRGRTLKPGPMIKEATNGC
jgi:antitoxin component YwqK of YwqJK toxin-antitoxin module